MINAESLSVISFGRPPLPRLAPADTPGLGGSVAPAGLHVLVVEDEWLISMEIEAALEEGGYSCVGVATTAREAVSLAEACRPQVVLMDIRLKGDQDGIDAAEELHRRFGLRVLFISAHADIATRERAASVNPLGWLPKPFSAPQLLQLLTTLRSELGQP